MSEQAMRDLLTAYEDVPGKNLFFVNYIWPYVQGQLKEAEARGYRKAQAKIKALIPEERKDHKDQDHEAETACKPCTAYRGWREGVIDAYKEFNTKDL